MNKKLNFGEVDKLCPKEYLEEIFAKYTKTSG